MSMNSLIAATWDARGGAIWLDREQWGVVIDALIEHHKHSTSRKAINPESTSDVRADECVRIIQTINAAVA